eukprot:s1322_g3.t1
MIGGLNYDGGPMPPGPPMGVREGGMPPNGGAASLQAKMNRQRQLALERQRVSARKQLGAGVIASSNPLMQSSPFRGGDWDQIVPDKLGISPSAKKETRSPGAAPRRSAPRSRSAKTSRGASWARQFFAISALWAASCGNAGHRTKAGLKRLGWGRATQGWRPPKRVQPHGDRRGQRLRGIPGAFASASAFKAVLAIGSSRRLSSMKIIRRLLARPSTVEEAPGEGLITPPAQPGKSWDLNVEVHEPKTDPGRRSKAGGKSWWPFSGANGGGPEGKEEVVTEISSFTFD